MTPRKSTTKRQTTAKKPTEAKVEIKKQEPESLFEFRRLLRGSSKYPIHIFLKGADRPLCGPSYGIFSSEPEKKLSKEEIETYVCWNCRWERNNGQNRDQV